MTQMRKRNEYPAQDKDDRSSDSTLLGCQENNKSEKTWKLCKCTVDETGQFQYYDIRKTEPDLTYEKAGSIATSLEAANRDSATLSHHGSTGIAVATTTLIHQKALIGGVYIPPSQPVAAYMDFSSSVEEIVALNNFAHIHLTGDFNLPGISWTSSQVVLNHSAIAISEMAELLGLSWLPGERTQIDVVELDFAKAFDRVDHVLLIRKLCEYGICGPLLKWFASYLHERKLQVRFHSALSKEFIATSGVPQGSHLGPTLFNIYINDITRRLSFNHLLFADDLKLYAKVTTHQDAINLQEDLNRVEEWCLENSMALNLDKCVCITFHRTVSPIKLDYSLSGITLSRVTTVKDLGVTITSTLNWDAHVQSACSQTLRKLGLIHSISLIYSLSRLSTVP
ncbi:uncharacterized protein LOC124369626 [Homalodisca vitripennis]|uniref:uncharacterized protein LOC124369626 n=1 Tax=Homalodisca vitripennis TaxID=197043 RepID=UPI001EEAF387|nr:uncharacterized protein LOC124369626 [Homalodisca vitripennis]